MTLIFTAESYRMEMSKSVLDRTSVGEIAWVNVVAKLCWEPRKYCLPVNQKTGYKYRYRANYKS